MGQVCLHRMLRFLFCSLMSATIFSQNAIGLEVLRSVETPATVQGLPSWAPDWTTPEVTPFRTGRVSRREEDLEFSEEFTKSTRDWSFSDYTISDGDQGTQLHIRSATMVGTVSRIGNVCDVYKDCFPLEQWEGICDPVHLSPCPAEPHVLRDCSQQDDELENLPLFIKALFKIRCYPRLMTDSVEMVRRFNNNLPDQEPMSPSVPTVPSGSVSYGYSETPSHLPLKYLFRGMTPSELWQCGNLFYHCHGRRLFVTDAGDLRLAPTAAVVGDQVMTIAGVQEPFVVKFITGESDAGSQVVRLVGACAAKLEQVGVNRAVQDPRLVLI